MIIAALGSLALGLLCGLFVFPPEVIAVMDTVMSYALAVLIFSVGTRSERTRRYSEKFVNTMCASL